MQYVQVQHSVDYQLIFCLRKAGALGPVLSQGAWLSKLAAKLLAPTCNHHPFCTPHVRIMHFVLQRQNHALAGKHSAFSFTLDVRAIKTESEECRCHGTRTSCIQARFGGWTQAASDSKGGSFWSIRNIRRKIFWTLQSNN